MIYDLARVDRQHLAIKNSRPAGICIPKRCACGLSCTAKQLAQYKKCPACVRADFLAAILPGDLAKLHNMLGAGPARPKKHWGLRNYYCAAGDAVAAMRRLLALGLVAEGRTLGAEINFHATLAGCKASGLDRNGVKRALGGES